VHDEERFLFTSESARAGLAPSPLGTRACPRVEHVGSLRPPARLMAAVEAHAAGALSTDELRAAQDDCIRDSVASQLAHGVSIVTDGELRRVRGRHELASRLADVTRFGLARGRQLPAGEHAAGASPVRGSHLVRAGHETLDPLPTTLVEEYRFIAPLSRRPAKVSLLGPDYLAHVLDPEGRNGFREHFDAVVSLERELIQEVIAAGCAYVQLDAPGYLAYADPVCVAEMRGRGIDPIGDLRWAVQADNAVVTDAGDVVVGLHMCRSYLRASASPTPAFDPFAELLFDQLVHQRLLIDFDVSRPDAFATLRFVPPGKEVVLGVVDSRSPRVETVEEVLRTVEAASRWASIDVLALSPTCGFASSDASAQITDEQQWRKLDVLVEVAARVWG
jgi:5-methyltetrahydropteroyltriglutamate--homocysteine methyltransferase